MKPPHILLAAGGTAGHVHPALALAEEMEKRRWRVSFAGTPRGSERAILRRVSIEPHLLPGAPFHRTTLAGRIRAIALVPISIACSAWLLRSLRIDGVIGFGGYASVGPVLAARMTRRFAAIVEPNAELGTANRMLRSHVDRIYTGMHTDMPAAPPSVVLRVGTIIRPGFRNQPPTPDPGFGNVFVFGEGLGAETSDYVEDPLPHYAAAGVVVCRAGANTLAEVAAIGRAAIIVPMGTAAADHQSRNAELWRKRGAAIVMSEEEWARNGRTVIDRLLRDDEARAVMAARARELAVFDAAERIVDDIEVQFERR